MTLATRIPFVGRTSECASIIAALESCDARAIVVAGQAGAGKSALLAHVLAQRAAGGALTGTGKHVGVGEANEPIITALESAVTAGLQSLYDPDGGLATLSDLLGAGAAALAASGRGPFRRLRGGTSSAPQLTADAAEARFSDMVLRVLRWLEGFQQPIILVLDDWGRCTHQTARLYRRIAADRTLTMLRVLASERPHESLGGIDATRIHLSAFSERDLLAFVAAKLGASDAFAEDVVNVLLETGATTPLLAANNLHRLESADCFDVSNERFDAKRAAAILRAFSGRNLMDDDRLATSPVHHVACTLALMETEATLAELKDGAGITDAEIAEGVSELETKGVVIVHRSDDRVTFSHDTFRDAILSRLSKEERIDRSGCLAEGLRRASTDPSSSSKGALMLRLRLAGGIDQVEPALWERNFYLGAAAARRRGERQNAHDFSQAAFDLASRRAGADHDILVEAALSAIEQGRHDTALRSIALMQDAAQERSERAKADELLVYAKRMSGDLDGALIAAHRGLARMNIKAPRAAFTLNSALAIARAVMSSPEEALDHPALSASQIAQEAPMMRATHALAALLFERSPLYAASFLARSVSPRLASTTAAGAAAYAVICSNLGLYHRGAAWARVSDARQSPEQPLRAAAMLYATNTGPRLLRGRANLAARRATLINLALEHGELSVALYTMRDRIQDALLSATPLSEIAAMADDALELAMHLQDPGIRTALAALRQTIDNLINTGSPKLDGRFYASDEGNSLELAAANTRRSMVIYEAILAASFGDYARVTSLHEQHKVLFGGVLRIEQSSTWIFVTTLSLLRCERKPSQRYLGALRTFSNVNPENHLHRQLLIHAEQTRTRGSNGEAMEFYKQAVNAAGGAWLERVIICRAAAEGARMLSDADAAACLEAQALEACKELGASALARSFQEPDFKPDATQTRLIDAEAAYAAVQRANVSRSRLLAAVSHELRTPLQGLRGIVELGDFDKPENRSALAGAVEQLTLAIDELTDLATSESGVINSVPGPLDVCQVLEDVAILARSTLGHGRKLSVTSSLSAPTLDGDAKRVRQVLNNLVVNAAKHGAGDIMLSAKGCLAGADRWQIHFTVRDEGAALPDATWTRLFEPFERGALSNGTGGLGLGLPISRRIAETLGGELVAEKTEDGRTCFRFSLTLDAWCGVNTAPPPVRANLKVLLAEDEPLSRRVIAAIMEREGATVSAASNGDEALQLLCDHEYDLILLDARMPIRSGLEVAEELRGRCPGATIALMSAAMDGDLAERAKALGLHCLKKPIGRAELMSLLSLQSETHSTPALDSHLPVSPSSPTFREVCREAQQLFEDIVEANESRQSEHTAFLAHKLAGLSAHFRLSALKQAADVIQAKSGLVGPSEINSLRTAILNLPTH